MNEAEDGGAESLASKFENQRHQFRRRRALERGGRLPPRLENIRYFYLVHGSLSPRFPSLSHFDCVSVSPMSVCSRLVSCQ